MGKNNTALSPESSEAFHAFLKKGGRSPAAIKRVFAKVGKYNTFLDGSGKSIDDANPEDLKSFADEFERKSKRSAKTHLWAIRYYYEFTSNQDMAVVASELRQERIVRTPFPLKKFRGVDPNHVQKLAEQGITNVSQMLKRGANHKDRQRLSEITNIPMECIVDFVKLSDLARIQGIKGVRARLYVDAGVDTIEKLSGCDPEAFRQRIVEFVESTGFDGIPTLPAEAISAVEKAKQLPIIIEI